MSEDTSIWVHQLAHLSDNPLVDTGFILSSRVEKLIANHFTNNNKDISIIFSSGYSPEYDFKIRDIGFELKISNNPSSFIELYRGDGITQSGLNLSTANYYIFLNPGINKQQNHFIKNRNRVVFKVRLVSRTSLLRLIDLYKRELKEPICYNNAVGYYIYPHQEEEHYLGYFQVDDQIANKNSNSFYTNNTLLGYQFKIDFSNFIPYYDRFKESSSNILEYCRNPGVSLI